MAGLLDVRPLRTSPAFRRIWVSTSLARVGGQMTFVAVLYQVWELTHSAVAVGTIGLAKAIPMVVFGQIGGALADAVDRRGLTILTTSGQIVSAGLLAAQALAGWDSVWVVFGLVALLASCGAVGAPARRTFAVRLLPAAQVSAAMALMQVSFQVAMLAGPAIGGVVIAQIGVAGCYVVDAATFVGALYGVVRLPTLRPDGDAGSTGVRAIREGWRFLARERVLRGTLLSDALATVMAMPIALFPVINDERFGGRPETLGLFLSAIAVGGMAAGAFSGAVTRSARLGAIMLASAIAWGAAIAGFGLSGHAWLGLGFLVIAGAADTIAVISRGAIIQLATPDSHRGRVSAAELMIGVAGPDLGNYRGGVVASVTSATFALASGGLICVVGVAALALVNKPLRRFRQ